MMPVRSDILCQALQLALELEYEQCVSVAIVNQARGRELDLLKLYDKLFDEIQPPRFRLFTALAKKPTSRRQEEVAVAVQPSKRDETWYVFDYYPHEVWSMLKQIVPGLTLYWETKLYRRLHPEDDGGSAAGQAEGIGAQSHRIAGIGARFIDVYVWAVLLGNKELALALLPACREPIRAAIIGARLFKFMADTLPLHATELMNAANDQETWALNLLDLCDTYEEARRMLTTKSRHWARAVVQLGVQSYLMNFTAHKYCQTLCDEWLLGCTIDDSTDTPSASLNELVTGGFAGSLKILLHAVFPFRPPFLQPIVIWRLPPAMVGEGWDVAQYTERYGRPPLGAFYQIPLCKQVIRFGVHCIFTSLVSYDITNRFHNESSLGMKIFLWVWTLSLVFDEWYKYICFRSTFVAEFWNLYDYTWLSFTLVALTLRMLEFEYAMEAMAFASILIWCRLFKYLMLSQSVGLLVVMIMNMFKDIALWILVTAIFLAAFTTAFVAISANSDASAIYDEGEGPLTAPMWAMLGHGMKEQATSWNPHVGGVLLAMHLVVAQIILINLLIAMMGYTFMNIKEIADEAWKFGRLQSVMESADRMSAVPPPLNLPLTLYEVLRDGVTSMLHMYSDGTSYMPLQMDADERAAFARAKKAKEKVAIKLLRKLKLKQEKDHVPGLLSVVEEFYTTAGSGGATAGRPTLSARPRPSVVLPRNQVSRTPRETPRAAGVKA